MPSLKALLPSLRHTNRLAPELFDYSETHYTCPLAAINTPTAHTIMGQSYAAEAGIELLRFAGQILGVKEIITWSGTKN